MLSNVMSLFDHVTKLYNIKLKPIIIACWGLL